MTKNDKQIEEIANGIISFLKSQDLLENLDELVSAITLKARNLNEVVYVISNRVLTSEEKVKAKNFIQEYLKVDSQNFEFSVDEKLLDGLVVKYKDRKWDLSLASQLQKLKSSLYD